MGEGFSYSNAGMDLVVYALERITGEACPEYVQKALGNPLEITLHYNTKEVYTKLNSVKGYLGEHEQEIVDPVGLGCGAAFVSIKDQAAFVRFLLNLGTVNGKEILKANYINAMHSVGKEGWYGLGTFVGREYGVTIPNHAGGGFGLCSEMLWIPEYDIGVAVLANQEAQGYIRALAKSS